MANHYLVGNKVHIHSFHNSIASTEEWSCCQVKIEYLLEIKLQGWMNLMVLKLLFRISFRSWSTECQTSCTSTLTSWRRGTWSSTGRGWRFKNWRARNEHKKYQPANTNHQMPTNTQKMPNNRYQPADTNQQSPSRKYNTANTNEQIQTTRFQPATTK